MNIDETDSRRLVENLGKEHILFRHDAAGVMSYVSPSITAILGYAPGEFRGHYSAFLTEDPANAAVPRITELGLRGERQPPYEVEVRHKDGGARWLEVTGFPVRDRSGTITGLEGIAKDVTGRKQLATAQQASERRFKELFAQAPLGVAMIDSSTGQIQELNPMFARIADRTEAEMRRVDWMSITHPDDIQKDLDQMARMNAGEIPGFRMEKRYLRPGGAVVWIDMTIAPLKLGADAPPHHLCMIQDITERKEMEEALSKSQKLSEGIINAITDEVWFADADKKFRLMNQAAIRNFATDKPVDVEELTRSLEVFRSDGSPRPVEEAPPLRALEGQTVINQEEIMRLPLSGELRHRQVSAAPVRDAQGAIIGSVSVVKDVTRQKQSESAHADMQRLESLGNLAGGIAHDFNNILTAILGNLSLLQAKLDGDGEALALLTEAREACGTAKGLSNELLTFAKGGAPVVQAADLRLVFAQAAVFAARGTKTRCVFRLGDAPLMVDIDKDLISRVVQNLVLNATQAMPLGGDFTVTAEIVDLGATANPPRAAGRFVRLTAEDQGMGIKPEALAKIFDPYFSTKGVGRGLGLSICYSIMLKHGGKISAALRPGAGAVFTLHFPCADAAGAADAPADREKPALKIGGGKVLIMDDEVSLARVLKRIVEHLGGEADTMTNGKDALDAYRRAMEAGKPFDVVIMDLTVAGGMGGMEMIGALLALDPSAKAIVSSGYADDPVMAGFARHGFSDKLAKPYDIEQVSAALRRVLGRS